MKMYPTTFALYDDINDIVAIFKAFDEETLSIELKEEIWCVDDLKKLTEAYEEATKQFTEGIEI